MKNNNGWGGVGRGNKMVSLLFLCVADIKRLTKYNYYGKNKVFWSKSLKGSKLDGVVCVLLCLVYMYKPV